MRRRPAVLLLVAAALGLGSLATGAAPVRGATCGAGSATLGDGGFETPLVDPGTYVQLDSSLVPPWLTTDGANEIEIWGLGFNGVPAAEGNQFAELNATTPGTLYQDVVTTAGEIMTWSIEHRGRDGADTMKVLIGDAATADVLSDAGWNYISPDLTDDNTAWGNHTATYVVPAGQTCTRFAFRAVSAFGGNPSVGNFLDATAFSVALPATPTPPPAPTPTPLPPPTPLPTPTPTPPMTATAGPVQGGSSGASLLLVFVLAGLGLAVGAWSVRRPRSRRGR